ncbi:MAG: ABC transporter permease [Pseudomonadota bacterium]
MLFQYIIKRLLTVIPVLLAVSTIVFFLIHAIPGDPVDLILGEQALAVDKAELMHELQLDEPVAVQYVGFLKGLVTGNWGTSIFDRQSVISHLADRWSATFVLAVCAMGLAIIFAIPIGVFAAIKKGTVWDQGAMLASLVGISVPVFWLGPVFILIFSVHLGILPISGRESLVSLILPSITLGAALAAMLSRLTRSSMIEEIKREYVVTARAKGLSEKKVMFKHALRNALNPVITIIGLQVGTLLAGTIITEKIFNWPGLGSLLLDSISRRDYPVVQGCILVIAFAYVIVNMITDCLYRAVDPRVKL